MPALRKYTDELCERAVCEGRTSGRPVAHVAWDLGVHEEALRQWVREAEAEQGGWPGLLSTAEKQELARLRKELDQPRTRPTR
ncbi:transposase [Streptomyces sp. NPDC050509]|uniref:transposase n=1 Tax=Streptomyces sp. NPDC050509 TaxID=3365620 RepID=UPI0037B43835